MAKLSGPQLTQLALQAGFPASDAQTAAAVALAESGGDPNIVNPSSKASGLWQILPSAHADLFRQYIWNDPAQNAKMAFMVWQQKGQSFTPWTTYTSGRYRLFLSQTGPANGSGVLTGALAGGYAGGLDNVAGGNPTTDIQTSLTDFITAASDPLFWTRVSMFLAGVVLVVVALHGLLSRTDIYKSAVKVAKVAAL